MPKENRSDSIVLLKPADEGKSVTKIKDEDFKNLCVFDAGFLFYPEVIKFDLDNLYDLVVDLSKKNDKFPILGHLTETGLQEMAAGRTIPRWKVMKEGRGATSIKSVPLGYAVIEVDNVFVGSFDPLNPVDGARQWLRKIGVDCAAVLQLSASQTLAKGYMKAHIWIKLKTPEDPEKIGAWCASIGADPSIYNCTSPVYTAAPVFRKGGLDGEIIDDPIEERIFKIPGKGTGFKLPSVMAVNKRLKESGIGMKFRKDNAAGSRLSFIDKDSAKDAIRKGKCYHHAILFLSLSLSGNREKLEVSKVIKDLMNEVQDKDDRWWERYNDIDRIAGDAWEYVSKRDRANPRKAKVEKPRLREEVLRPPGSQWAKCVDAICATADNVDNPIAAFSVLLAGVQHIGSGAFESDFQSCATPIFVLGFGPTTCGKSVNMKAFLQFVPAGCSAQIIKNLSTVQGAEDFQHDGITGDILIYQDEIAYLLKQFQVGKSKDDSWGWIMNQFNGERSLDPVIRRVKAGNVKERKEDLAKYGCQVGLYGGSTVEAMRGVFKKHQKGIGAITRLIAFDCEQDFGEGNIKEFPKGAKPAGNVRALFEALWESSIQKNGSERVLEPIMIDVDWDSKNEKGDSLHQVNWEHRKSIIHGDPETKGRHAELTQRVAMARAKIEGAISGNYLIGHEYYEWAREVVNYSCDLWAWLFEKAWVESHDKAEDFVINKMIKLLEDGPLRKNKALRDSGHYKQPAGVREKILKAIDLGDRIEEVNERQSSGQSVAVLRMVADNLT